MWCRLSHRRTFCGALAYADDVTLVAQSRSGIRTLINVCEQFALDYDITFNGTKSQLMFFKGTFSNVSACGFHVNGQYVEVSKCGMHLGHSISSGDRTEIVKYAKISFWSSFNIFRADFGHISSQLKKCIISKILLCFLWITLVAFRRCYDSLIICGLEEGIEMCMVC